MHPHVHAWGIHTVACLTTVACDRLSRVFGAIKPHLMECRTACACNLLSSTAATVTSAIEMPWAWAVLYDEPMAVHKVRRGVQPGSSFTPQGHAGVGFQFALKGVPRGVMLSCTCHEHLPKNGEQQNSRQLNMLERMCHMTTDGCLQLAQRGRIHAHSLGPALLLRLRKRGRRR